MKGFEYYLIMWEANVVIKREDEFYEVPIKMRFEEKNDDAFLDLMGTAYEQFASECDKISAHWKLVDEELDGPYGKVIGQTKIEL